MSSQLPILAFCRSFVDVKVKQQELNKVGLAQCAFYCCTERASSVPQRRIIVAANSYMNRDRRGRLFGFLGEILNSVALPPTNVVKYLPPLSNTPARKYSDLNGGYRVEKSI